VRPEGSTDIIARIFYVRNAYKPPRKSQFTKHRRRKENNVETEGRKMVCEE
jgi:hypothetical protein